MPTIMAFRILLFPSVYGGNSPNSQFLFFSFSLTRHFLFDYHVFHVKIQKMLALTCFAVMSRDASKCSSSPAKLAVYHFPVFSHPFVPLNSKSTTAPGGHVIFFLSYFPVWLSRVSKFYGVWNTTTMPNLFATTDNEWKILTYIIILLAPAVWQATLIQL